MKELLFANADQKTVRFTFNISNDYGKSLYAQTFFIATDVTNPSNYSLSIPVAGSGNYTEVLVLDVPQTQMQNAMSALIATTPTQDTGLGLLFSRTSGMFNIHYHFINETQEYTSYLGALVNNTQMALYIGFTEESDYHSAEEFLNKLLTTGEVIIDIDLIMP